MTKTVITTAASLLLLSGVAAPTRAQGLAERVTPTPAHAEATPAPTVADSVTRKLEAPYITPEEAKDLRIFHGVWTDADLDTPERAARAAIIRGDYTDPALDADGVSPLDRAEAALERGRPQAALTLLGDAPPAPAPTARAGRIRARALETLGRHADAAASIEASLVAFDAQTERSPDDIVEAVRMAGQYIRLKGPAGKLPGDAAQDYHAMIRALGEVRAKVDRLHWPALLAEAELLYAKDNNAQADEAVNEVLSLNPSCARAWALLGRLAVDSFNFDAAGGIAARLDELAGFTGSADDRNGLSPIAAEIRARAALRQIDGEAAARELEPALALDPDHPTLLALRAAAEAVRFEYDGAKTRLAALDAKYPGSPQGVYEVGRSLAEARQYAEAAAFLEEAARRLPTAPEPWIDLGLLEIQSGRDVRAQNALEKAFSLDPFNVRADNSLRLIRELVTYDTLESEHFVVRFKQGPDGVMARDMLAPLEELHGVVAASVRHEPAQKTIIDLMPDHEWFGVRIAGMPAIHTIAASTGPVVAMEAPRNGPNHLGTYDWVRVVRHEYVHTVTLSRTRNRIPHWFTEAAAVYLELSPRDYATCRLLTDVLESDALFDFVQINRAFVRPEKPTDRQQAYAQGHWMYEYIVERWGDQAPLDLMDLYAQGVREEQAFGAVLGVTREQFFEGFKDWAREQLVAWGMLPEPGTPSVKELLAEAAKFQAPTEGPEAEGDDAEPPADAEPVAITDDRLVAWLDAYPEHPDLLDLAVDHAVQKNGGRATPEIAPLLERYAKARPVDPKPHRLLAKMYLDSGAEPQRAAEHLAWLDAREQRTPAYATELAKRAFAAGDLPTAQAKAERATHIAPYEAPPRELAATIAIAAKDFPTAERHITALTVLEPTREIHKQRLEALTKMMASQK